jgi:hypothetical protein
MDDETTVCVSYFEAGSRLLVVGLTMLVLILVNASISQGLPLDQLGRRPKGTGLFSYTVHFWSDGVGVLGYDPILGSLSPPLRLLVHIAACLVLCAVRLLLITNKDVNNCVTLWVGAATLAVVVGAYAVLCLALSQFGKPVSWPGDPRPHKIQRQPAWPNQERPLPDTTTPVWRCVHDSESHVITEKLFDMQLTGEATGRDIWVRDHDQSNNTAGVVVDEALVKELASGGRRTGDFNPSVNPNRY